MKDKKNSHWSKITQSVKMELIMYLAHEKSKGK